jgi:hypothetical protein
MVVFAADCVTVDCTVDCRPSTVDLRVDRGPWSVDQIYSPSNLSLNFVFSPAQNVEDYIGLVQLHDTSWDLTDENMLVIFSEAANTDTLKILNGTLKFTRAQHLFVDKVSEEAILSGTFEFQANYNETFTTFSNGRFDVGISKNNFYRP